MTFAEVESARKAYHEKIKQEWTVFGVIAGIAAIIYLVTGGLSSPLSLFGLLFILFFFGTFYLIISYFLNRKVATAYKETYNSYFVARNLSLIFSDLRYDHTLGLSEAVLRSTGMINTGDVYHSNDFASGRYKDVAFSQADVHIQEEHTDSDGNTTYVTIFRGKFMIFEFPKKFSFKLELVGKKFHAYRVPGKNPATGRKMQKISTESGEFNKSFRIFAEDGFEAFYLLDPAFMIKIQDISSAHDYKNIFCFIENRLIIGLNDGKDSFEPPKATKSLDEAVENAKIASDIKTITDFVDQLSLNRKLFSK